MKTEQRSALRDIAAQVRTHAQTGFGDRDTASVSRETLNRWAARLECLVRTDRSDGPQVINTAKRGARR